MKEPLLSIKNLNVVYSNQKKAIDNLSLDIYPGETLALVGESGSGKSTLCRAIMRLITPSSGSMTYDNLDLLSLNVDALALLRQEIQCIFQDPDSALNPRMTMEQIMVEPLFVQKRGNAHSRRKCAEHLVKLVGLRKEKLDAFPHEFSGGQKQRIGLARALSLEPRLLICDEPTSALDVSIQAQIIQLLQKIQKEIGLAYLFITHDLSLARQIADRIAVMHKGKLVEIGTPDEVFENPKDAYTKELLNS